MSKSNKRELSAVEYYTQISSKEVCRILGIGHSTLWVWIRAGRLPAPRYLAPPEPRWRLGEIVELLEQQPRFSDAPRGLKGAASTGMFASSEKDPAQWRKAASVWERLGSSGREPHQRFARHPEGRANAKQCHICTPVGRQDG